MISGNEPLYLLVIGRVQDSNEKTVLGCGHVPRIDRMTIILAATLVMKHRIGLVRIPVMSVGVADRRKPGQCEGIASPES